MTARRRHAPSVLGLCYATGGVLTALPVTGFMVPMRTTLFPAGRNPVITPPFTDPTALDPDVLVPAPFPISRRPNEAHARRRHRLDSHGRRRDVDVDANSG